MNDKTCSFCKDQSNSLPAERVPPLVSVIVPVYKVEDVLVRCLDSLCRQSLREIEIVLIDDASPDRCSEICEQYSTKDTRFKVIHQLENRGLSVARNTGIAHASSDYLMFVDSDDWVHEDFCKVAYECAVKHETDIVVFGYERIGFPNTSFKRQSVVSNIPKGMKTGVEAIHFLLKGNGSATWTTWNKLYRKELFKKVSYPPGYLYEDIGTTYKLVWHASNVYYLDKVLYYHCYHEGSITTLKTEKALHDKIEMCMQQYRDLERWGYSAEELDIFIKNVALTYCIQKKPDADDSNYAFCRKVLKSSKQIPEGFTWKRKVLFVLLKYCPPLFELVCELWGKRWSWFV